MTVGEEKQEAAAAPGQPLARRIFLAGAVAFWTVQLLLTFVAGVPLLDALVVTVLLVLLPVMALAQLPMIEGAEIEREPAYVASITTLWLVGTGCWLVGTRDGGAAAVGLVGLPALSMIAWSAGLTLGALAIILIFRETARFLGVPETPLLRALLPRTRRERTLFGVVSLAAGTGEEVAYRGYLIPVLATVTGLGPAAVLSTLVFGVLHAYQGWLGVLRTGVMGAMLAAGFLASGSLWPPIIAHVLIDVLAGIVLGERLLLPMGDNAVESAVP